MNSISNAFRGQGPKLSDSVILIINSSVGGLGGIFFWICASRFFDQESIGLVTTIVSIIISIGTFSILGTGESLKSYIPNSSDEERFNLLEGSFFLSIIIGFLCSGAFTYLLISETYLSGLPESTLVSILVLLSIPMFSSIAIFSSFLVSMREMIWPMNSTIAVHTVRILLLLVLGEYFRDFQNSTSMLIAWFSGLVIGFSYISIVILRSYPPGRSFSLSPRLESLSRMKKISIANLILGSRFHLSLALGGAIVLEKFGPASAAEFFILWRASFMATTVPYSLSTVSLVHRGHEGGKKTFVGLIPAMGSVIASLAFFISLNLLLPFFEGLFDSTSMFLIAPWALSILPSHLLMMNISDWRFNEQSVPISVSALATTVMFLSLLAFADGASQIGWFWLFTLTLVSLSGFFFREKEQTELIHTD